MDPVIIVGLGNPGAEYEGTRHNVGFAVTDELLRRLHMQAKPGRGEYWIGRGRVGETDVVLAKPVTYMNNSGTAVGELLQLTGSPVANLIVITDDFAIPLGTIRIRTRGSDGGHNGLASIILQLGTSEFPRIRCGIGRETLPPGEEKAEFVLSQFVADEKSAVAEMIQQAADAALECITGGIGKAMTKFNVRRPTAGTGNTQDS